MGGIANIAQQLGHTVSGSDQHVYPPMSTQLGSLGIELMQGYSAANLQTVPDQIVVGNTISRGNPELEAVLNQQLPFYSGPEWLYREVLHNKHVLAVSGTHGKTTTTTILTWLLERAGLNPGFLIGGVAENFGISARVTDSDYFVIEADEYDTAFSDKRSKFVHYHPQTLIVNNIEFDHADIFDDVSDIRREFHHLIRMLPEQARIIYPDDDQQVQQVIELGCWSQTVGFGKENSEWNIDDANQDFSKFSINQQGVERGRVNWSLLGEHNANNALAAVIAADHVGISVAESCDALSGFKSVKRRLECIMDSNGIRLYDDFAHHPTAISSTLKALRQNVNAARIIAVMEPRSNTMKMGVHANTLADSFSDADSVIIYQSDSIDWNIAENMSELGDKCRVFYDTDEIVARIKAEARSGDTIIIMSNGGFDGIHEKLINILG